MDLKERLEALKKELPADVQLVAVSKMQPVSVIEEAYNLGHRAFGENKVQELCSKQEELPKDIEWHMIGHLQRNKVKYIAPFVHLIHSVDSERLLSEINKQGERFDRRLDCLLQIHIAEEETKFGLDRQELAELMENYREGRYPGVRLRGLMGMATLTDRRDRVALEFQGLRELFVPLSEEFESFDILSMGMSGDYRLAIAEGSNMVRIGSSVFGPRPYSKS